MASFTGASSMAGSLGWEPNNWYQSRFDSVRGAYEEPSTIYHGFRQGAPPEPPSLPPTSAEERRFQTLEGMVLTLEIKSDKLDQKLDELIREFNLSQIPTAMAPPHPPPPDPYDSPLPGPYGYSLPFSVPYDYYYNLQQHYSTPPPPTPHHCPSSSVQWQPMMTQITPHSHVSKSTPLQQQKWQYQPGFLPSHSEQYVSDEMSVRKESHEGPKSKAPYVFDEISVRVEAPHKESEISGLLLEEDHVRSIVNEGQAHQFETEDESLEVATESIVRGNEESNEDMVFDGMYEKKSNSVLEDVVAKGNGAVEFLLASNVPSRDRVVDDDVVGEVEAISEELVASEKTDATDSPLLKSLMGPDLRTQAMVAKHYIFGGHNEETSTVYVNDNIKFLHLELDAKNGEGLLPCEVSELKPGTHYFAVYGDNFFKPATYTIEGYVQKVDPSHAPLVVGKLLDAECPENSIKGPILSVCPLLPVKPLVDECEKRIMNAQALRDNNMDLYLLSKKTMEINVYGDDVVALLVCFDGQGSGSQRNTLHIFIFEYPAKDTPYSKGLSQSVVLNLQNQGYLGYSQLAGLGASDVVKGHLNELQRNLEGPEEIQHCSTIHKQDTPLFASFDELSAGFSQTTKICQMGQNMLELLHKGDQSRVNNTFPGIVNLFLTLVWDPGIVQATSCFRWRTSIQVSC